MSKRCVVAGATGYAGRAVVTALASAGWRVRALARDKARLGKVAEVCDEIVVAEATQPETLAGLCDGADAVFSSLGVRHFKRSPTVWDVDFRANMNVVHEAARAGVSDFVFLSLLHGDTLRRQLAVAEARERVVDALASTAMRVTVLRPTGFFNDMDQIFEMARHGAVWTVGSGEARLNPLAAEDIAAVVVEVLADPAAAARVIELGGPEVYSMNEIAAGAFAALGKAGRVRHLSPSLLRFAARMAKPFNTNAATFLRMFALLGEVDCVAPLRGTHRLLEHYERMADSLPPA